MDVTITPANDLRGEVQIPGDKSISHRALMIGAISEGVTEILNCSPAGDPMSTLECLQALGANIEVKSDAITIHGKGLRGLQVPSTVLDAGNSGTTMRLLTGILAGQRFNSEITGDKYLVQRPMKRIIDPLTEMGAQVIGTYKFTAPLKIFGVEKLKAIRYELPLPSAQVKSAVLFAGLYADGVTQVVEPVTSRDHTERMLGLNVHKENGTSVVEIEGGRKLEGKKIVVPGDISASAFFMVAASIVPYSELVIRNVGLNPTRAGVIDVLRRMGANIEITNCQDYGEPFGDVIVKTAPLKGIILRGEVIPNIIDEIPILAVAGAVCEGTFEVRGAYDLRNKETDRISAICENLSALGLDVEEFDDGFAFEGNRTKLVGTELNSFGDHRIAMAFSIAGLVASGTTTIIDADCANISFPGFWNVLNRIRN
jgi:3-phosphoshikimate 1-carboxyvinyltransferase